MTAIDDSDRDTIALIVPRNLAKNATQFWQRSFTNFYKGRLVSWKVSVEPWKGGEKKEKTPASRAYEFAERPLIS